MLTKVNLSSSVKLATYKEIKISYIEFYLKIVIYY